MPLLPLKDLMISQENLSAEQLRKAFAEFSPLAGSLVDEYGCLRVTINNKAFLVSVIGPHQVRFFIPSSTTPPSGRGVTDLLRIANGLNSDLALTASAYVSEGGDLIFTHALSVSGGISDQNVVTAFHEFAVESAIFEQIVEKAFTSNGT